MGVEYESAEEMNDAEDTRCPVCGETAPTKWICLLRLTGNAPRGEPCDYSEEGHERTGKMLEHFAKDQGPNPHA